jgi:hypothetical protein
MGAKDIVVIGLVAVIVGLLTFLNMPRLVTIPSLPAKIENVVTKPVSNNQKDCEAAGGKWERIGDSGQLRCNSATSDAGKACSDRSDCESFCWAGEGPEAYQKTSGTCYPWKYFKSCISSVNNGRTTAICLGEVRMIPVTVPLQ